MKKSTKSKSKYVLTIKTRPKLIGQKEAKLHHREKLLINDFSKFYGRSKVSFVGAGALGGNIGYGVVRKGVKKVVFYDGDTVDSTNLPRQRFYVEDIGHPKSFSLVKNLAAEAIKKTELVGANLYFEEAIQSDLFQVPDVIVCCPDNDNVREFTAKLGKNLSVSVITTGLSADADYGYVHVFDPESKSGCWSCARRGNLGAKHCGPTPANINIVFIITGLVLSALDSIICQKPLPWNYKRISISGNLPEISSLIPIWQGCPICQKPAERK